MLPPGLFDKITSHLLNGQNQFASGGLLLMVIGGIVASLKSIPSQIYGWFIRQSTITMTITDEQSAFVWFKWWFQKQEYAKRFRNIDAFTPRGADEKYVLMFAPAPGKHWFFRKKRPLFITLIRSDEKKAAGSYDSRRTESYVLWTYGRNQKYMSDLLTEIREGYLNSFVSKPTLEVWDRDDWRAASAYTPRALDSVILPGGYKEEILRDIDQFKESRAWYERMGIPFHRGYLIFGPPGTGKTSLVTGLSSHYNCRVYVLKLSEMMNDTALVRAIGRVYSDSMVVIEDVDCTTVKRDITITESSEPKPEGSKKEETLLGVGVTLSGLLNALDGMQTPPGVMFFMTTNHIEKLDHALLRPGRTDVKMFIGSATEEQKLTLYKRFFPTDDEISATQFSQQFPAATSMAEFQELLMKERNRRSGSDISETKVKAARV